MHNLPRYATEEQVAELRDEILRLKRQIESAEPASLSREDFERATHIETGMICWSWKKAGFGHWDHVESNGRHECAIKFKMPFPCAPTVFTSVQLMDCPGGHYSINIENLSPDGFTAAISTWGNGKLYRFSVFWIAIAKGSTCFDHGQLFAPQSTGGGEPE